MTCSPEVSKGKTEAKGKQWPRGLLQCVDDGTPHGKELLAIKKRFDNAKRYVRNGAGTLEQADAIVDEAVAWMQRNNMQASANARIVQVATKGKVAVADSSARNANALALLDKATAELVGQRRSLASADTALGELADEDEAAPSTVAAGWQFTRTRPGAGGACGAMCL